MANITADRRQKIRIFFSADISGSTPFKGKNPAENAEIPGWPAVFKRFFLRFGKVFNENMERCKAEADPVLRSRRLPPDLHFWKANGDEILYWSILVSEKHLYIQVQAFYDTVRQFDAELSPMGMGVKGTVWSAGFPIRNGVVHFPMESRSLSAELLNLFHNRIPDLADSDESLQQKIQLPRYVDYVGMEIDAGFRLTAHTRAGRITVSPDIAWWLTSFTPSRPFHYYHVGWRVLRGCYGEQPYPIIWIVRGIPARRLPWDGYDCDLTQQLLTAPECSPSDLKSLIEDYRKAMEGFIIKPYYDAEHDEIPNAHQLKWERGEIPEEGTE